MCFPAILRVWVFCLVLFHNIPCLSSQGKDDWRTIQSDKKQITLLDHEETTQDGNLNRTVTYRDYESERKNILTKTRNCFVLKLLEKYGTGETLPFEGFEHMLERIRLGNLSFPDHNITVHKSNSLATFVSKHTNHTHFPATSFNNKYKRSVYVPTQDNVSDSEHHNITFYESSQNKYHYGNVTPLNQEDSTANGVNKRSHNDTLLGHSEMVPLQEPYFHSNHSSINHTEKVHPSSEMVQTLKHSGINATYFHENNQSLLNYSNELVNVSDFSIEKNEHPDIVDSDFNIKDNNVNCIQGDIGQNDLRDKRKDRNGQHAVRQLADNDATENKCLTPQEIWKSYTFGVTEQITMSDFIDLCPALLYQMDTRKCLDDPMATSFDSQGHPTKDDRESQNEDPAKQMDYKISEIPAKVWGFSCLTVVIISIVGLLCVAIIPIVNKIMYNHLLNFLVSLAVGALSGDALLHLLPHALEMSEDHSHKETDSGNDMGGIMKGLCCLSGIYLFFLIENIMVIITDYKRQQIKKKNQKSSEEQMLDVLSPPRVAEELSVMEYKKCEELSINTQNIQGEAKNSSKSIYLKDTFGHNDEEIISLMNQPEPSRSHSHSHSHQVDPFPHSTAAISWIVILGDGIHNLSDGLVIGAAFGASITSGFSTSIAVFCHEIPHEIGDFAMLLKSGMSVKQAVCFNIVSSILCFIGMVIGVMLGNGTSASLWIFAGVAGMFLYIALVDMLPEIRNNDGTFKIWIRLFDLILQSAAMFLGAGIMLLIALHEDKIQTALDQI